MQLIRSRGNTTFKELKSLAELARERRRRGVTLLDGIHLIATYRDKVGMPERLIISEHGMGLPEVRVLAESLAPIETVFLHDALFRELSELTSPVGVCATISIPAANNPATSGSCVLLDAVQDPGNVGSILRTVAAAGLCDVFLGPGCAGAWTPRVLRAGQGAHFDLRLHEQADLGEIIAGFAGVTIATTVHGGEPIYRQNLQGRLAWLFGNEGAGISGHFQASAAQQVHIPIADGSESLNVAAAAAICLFEEVRQKRFAPRA